MMKKTWSRVLILTMAVLLCLTSVAAAEGRIMHSTDKGSKATVAVTARAASQKTMLVTEPTAVYAGATDKSKVLMHVAAGTQVIAGQTKGRFTLVTIGSTQGYVLTNLLIASQPAQNKEHEPFVTVAPYPVDPSYSTSVDGDANGQAIEISENPNVRTIGLTVNATPLYGGPTKYSKALADVAAGEYVIILSVKSVWAEVFHNDMVGWMRTKDLVVVAQQTFEPEPTPTPEPVQPEEPVVTDEPAETPETEEENADATEQPEAEGEDASAEAENPEEEPAEGDPEQEPQSASSDDQQATEQQPAYELPETLVVNCDADIRIQPDGMSDIFLTLPAGTEVTVLGMEGEWIKVLVNDQEGYIYMDHVDGLTPVKPAEEDVEVEPAPQEMRVVIFTSRRTVMKKGEPVNLTSKLEGFENYEVMYQWECDKGEGFAPVEGAVSDSYSFEATAETLSWHWRLTVSYR